MVLFTSLTLNRLFFQPRLAPVLLPTMAIELAPAAVAGNAYLLLHPGPPDTVLFTLSGYAVLMVIAQLRFLPLYRTLSFTAPTPAHRLRATPSPLAGSSELQPT
jgi:tellurite resistance protein